MESAPRHRQPRRAGPDADGARRAASDAGRPNTVRDLRRAARGRDRQAVVAFRRCHDPPPDTLRLVWGMDARRAGARTTCRVHQRDQRGIVPSADSRARGASASCRARRVTDTAAYLVDQLLPRRPLYRQRVLTVPWELHYRFSIDAGS